MREVIIDGVRYVPEPPRVVGKQTLGQFLFQHRTRMRLSFKVASAASGISITTLHSAENGSLPSLDTAVRLADFYGFSLDDLMAMVRATQVYNQPRS